MHDNKGYWLLAEKAAIKSFSFSIIISILFFGLLGCGRYGSLSVNEEDAASVKSPWAAELPMVRHTASVPQSSPAEVPADSNKATVIKDENRTIIVIDPGHGSVIDKSKEPIAPGSKELKAKNTIGAVGAYTKTPEYKIAFDVAFKLKKILEDRGYKVIMTKDLISKNPSNIERAEVGNRNNAGLVVRIHADSSTTSSVKGTSILVPSGINEGTIKIKSESEVCARAVLAKLKAEAGARGRGIVERKDLTGFNWSRVPVILIEMGFLSNKQEDISLNDAKNQDKIAAATADGIDEYFTEKARKPASN